MLVDGTDDAFDWLEALEDWLDDLLEEDDATDELLVATLDDAFEELAELATLDADDELAAAGLYEHQAELLGAPGKFDSAQAKLPVKVAYANVPDFPIAA